MAFQTHQLSSLRRSLVQLLAAASVLLLQACDNSESATEPYHHQVAAVPLVAQDSYQVQRYFVGRIEARQQSTLGFELHGTIDQLLVDEGDQVGREQVLVRLDQRIITAELKVLAAEVEELQAQRRLTQIDIKRQQALRQKGFAAEQRLDELQTELSALAARMKSKQAQRETLETQLAKHSIKAPFAGEVSVRYVDSGATVGPGQLVLELLETVSPELRVGVPHKLLSKKSVGDTVRVMVREQIYTAQISAIVNSVDPVTNTSVLKIRLTDDVAVTSGEVAYLSLLEDIPVAGFWVPATALTAGVRGMWNVYVLIPDGDQLQKIEARSVELLYMAGGRAYIRGALKGSEQLVANGLHKVVPGLRVRVPERLAQIPKQVH